MSKAVKLADIASALNVSTVTVSKALSDQKGVGNELRERIKKLAGEMGYVSPTEAKKQKEAKSYNIGVLLSERYFDQQQSFYWQLYQTVAVKAVEKECFTMLEVLSVCAEQELEMPKLLRERKADGLIILGLLKEDYMSMVEENIDIPFVCLDFYDRKQEWDCVISDNFYGMYRLTDYLFELGHTDIAYVGTLLYSRSITDRYFGYAKALLEHGQKVRDEWVLDDRDLESGQRGDRFAFSLPERMPTAFVCNCDLTAGILINQLEAAGYRVPEDISVVGFDDYIFPGICSKGITTYRVDMEEMAGNAIESLTGKITGEDYRRGITIVEGRMVVRESAGDVRRRHHEENCHS